MMHMGLFKTTLTGIGQIFLQQSALSGLIIAIGMFFSHWTLAVACLLGSLIGTICAHLLKADDQAIAQGLYGFNGSLSFMAVLFTFGLVDASNPVIWLLGLTASIVSTIIMHIFLLKQKPAFTFPFIATSWLFCWGVAQLGLFGLSQTTPPLPDHTSIFASLQFPFYAWAEVNFGASAITGVLLCLAVAIHTPIAAVYGMMAAIIGTLMAHYLFGVDANTLANGIYGFAPILVACVFAGSKLSDLCLIVLGVLLAVSIQYGITLTGLAPYTIGFVVATWLLLPLKAKLINYRPQAAAKFS